MHAITNLNTSVHMTEQEIIEVLTAHVRKVANIPANMELEDSWISRPTEDCKSYSFQAFFTQVVQTDDVKENK